MTIKPDFIRESAVLNVEAVRNSIELDNETTAALKEANKKIKEQNKKYDFQVIEKLLELVKQKYIPVLELTYGGLDKNANSLSEYHHKIAVQYMQKIGSKINAEILTTISLGRGHSYSSFDDDIIVQRAGPIGLCVGFIGRGETEYIYEFVKLLRKKNYGDDFSEEDVVLLNEIIAFFTGKGIMVADLTTRFYSCEDADVKAGSVCYDATQFKIRIK